MHNHMVNEEQTGASKEQIREGGVPIDEIVNCACRPTLHFRVNFISPIYACDSRIDAILVTKCKCRLCFLSSVDSKQDRAKLVM